MIPWIHQTSPVALVILALLLILSITSWSIILLKWFSLRKAEKNSSEFTDLFWKIRRFDQLFDESRHHENSPVARMFRQGYRELQLNELGLEQALRKAGRQELKQLESMVPFLATVGSTSPFIGLLGTVIGIMASFEQIGLRGSASLASVAPGISEALIATAAGLLAAIPAVMAYNHFSNQIRSIASEMDTFSNDFISLARHHASRP
ncbi:MAG: protein TolQ [Myxococcaceae bacterium]|nr:protein TolQ [Myxococcaceae bacterium]MBH2006281.1 protein TolQ [Myxococcaceae bacterium]